MQARPNVTSYSGRGAERGTRERGKCRIKVGPDAKRGRSIHLGESVERIFRDLMHRAVGAEDSDVGAVSGDLSTIRMSLEFVGNMPWDSTPTDLPDGHISHLDPEDARTMAQTLRILKTSDMPLARVSADYVINTESQHEQEISLRAGQILEIWRHADRGWSFGKIVATEDFTIASEEDHSVGWFPTSFTEPLDLDSLGRLLTSQGIVDQQDTSGGPAAAAPWMVMKREIPAAHGVAEVTVEGGLSEERHALLMERLSEIRVDLSRHLNIPMSHMQLQFSHTGVVAQVAGGSELAHSLSSWMSVDVEIAPLIDSAEAGARRDALGGDFRALAAKAKHTFTAASMVSSMADPHSGLRRAPSFGGWRRARVEVQGKMRFVNVEIEPLDEVTQLDHSSTISVSFDPPELLPSEGLDEHRLSAVIAEWSLHQLQTRHCKPHGFDMLVVSPDSRHVITTAASCTARAFLAPSPCAVMKIQHLLPGINVELVLPSSLLLPLVRAPTSIFSPRIRAMLGVAPAASNPTADQTTKPEMDDDFTPRSIVDELFTSRADELFTSGGAHSPQRSSLPPSSNGGAPRMPLVPHQTVPSSHPTLHQASPNGFGSLGPDPSHLRPPPFAAQTVHRSPLPHLGHPHTLPATPGTPFHVTSVVGPGGAGLMRGLESAPQRSPPPPSSVRGLSWLQPGERSSFMPEADGSPYNWDSVMAGLLEEDKRASQVIGRAEMLLHDTSSQPTHSHLAPLPPPSPFPDPFPHQSPPSASFPSRPPLWGSQHNGVPFQSEQAFHSTQTSPPPHQRPAASDRAGSPTSTLFGPHQPSPLASLASPVGVVDAMGSRRASWAVSNGVRRESAQLAVAHAPRPGSVQGVVGESSM